MRRIRISEEALQDLSDAFAFYEAHETGLGDYFTSCLRADIESLRLYAGIHRIVYRDYYRLLGKVFPFGVFYTVDGDEIRPGSARVLKDSLKFTEHLAK